MPHATVKLVPGVDTNKTPTLNEAAVSYTDLVRFMPDRSGYGLVQKLGGWTRYISGTFSAPIRALKAWSDLENTKYLAIGGESDVGVQVYNQDTTSLVDVTPAEVTQNLASSFITTGNTVTSTNSHADCKIATTANLTATYNNGASGVGATLTNSGTNAPLIIDGNTILTAVRSSNIVTLTFAVNHQFSSGGSIRVYGVSNATFDGTFTVTNVLSSTSISYAQTAADASSSGGTVGFQLAASDRVVVKNQSTGAQNGVYTVTNVGSASVAWVLTRATDFDAWATNDIEYGALFFVSNGTTNKNEYFYCTNTTTVTVGTTAIAFAQGLGFKTESGSSSVTFYTPVVPSSASYVFFPTIMNVGNINLVGPYDILSVGNGYVTFSVPSVLSYISKIVSVTAGSNRTVTITFLFPHSFYAGQRIYVAGVTDSSFNGTFTIGSGALDVTTYTITYTQTGVTTATSSSGGTVNAAVIFGGVPPKYETTSGTTVVKVTLINHGYAAGSTFNAPVSTTVGGTTISGLYTVTKVNSTSEFEIAVDIPATSSTTGYENSGAARAVFLVANVSDSQSSNAVYGGGIYGDGIYGSGFVPEVVDGDPITATDWSLDNWGSILIACPKGGAIYYWQPVGSAIKNLSYMPNAPVYNSGALVAMPQRQVVAYGSSFGTIQDPLLVRWCDLEDFTIWIGQANNQAGSYRIPTGSKIVGAIQASQQTLLWTDLDLWSMTYIGQPYIYGFNKIGANAGLIAPKAVAEMGGVTYWMSQKQFFKFSGNGVEVIPCPIWDQVFQNFFPGVDGNGNPYTDRIRCAANSQFTEITWYFPAHYTNDIDPSTGLALDAQQIGTGEVNAYAKYNVALNQWDYGYQHPDNPDVLVGRTAWVDQSILGPPIGAAAATSVVGQTSGFYIYQHETSNDADGVAMESGFTTGYAALSDGNEMMFIDQVWPDMKWGFVDEPKTAVVKLTFYVTNYPGDAPIQYGPYDITQSTQYLSVRMRGRLIAMGISSTDAGSFWRIGALRYRYQPDGKY